MNPDPVTSGPAAGETDEPYWFVTGANGFLGSTIVAQLVAQSAQVGAGLHSSLAAPAIAGLECDRVLLDVADQQSIIAALTGADPKRAGRTIVVHTASIVSIADRIDPALRATNVDGVANLLAACRAVGVRRLVYVSSVHAIPDLPGGVLAEVDHFDPELVVGAYAKSKAKATQLVADASDLDRVIIHPTGLLGPGDHGATALTTLIRDLADRRLPALVAGGYDFVDVRDAAAAIIVAGLQGRTGEAYLLGGGRMSIPQIAQIIAEATGGRRPPVLPIWVARLVVPLVGLLARVRRTPPIFTNYSLDVLQSQTTISHRKASAELDFRPRELRQTVLDTLAWVQTVPR